MLLFNLIISSVLIAVELAVVTPNVTPFNPSTLSLVPEKSDY